MPIDDRHQLADRLEAAEAKAEAAHTDPRARAVAVAQALLEGGLGFEPTVATGLEEQARLLAEHDPTGICVWADLTEAAKDDYRRYARAIGWNPSVAWLMRCIESHEVALDFYARAGWTETDGRIAPSETLLLDAGARAYGALARRDKLPTEAWVSKATAALAQALDRLERVETLRLNHWPAERPRLPQVDAALELMRQVLRTEPSGVPTNRVLDYLETTVDAASHSGLSTNHLLQAREFIATMRSWAPIRTAVDAPNEAYNAGVTAGVAQERRLVLDKPEDRLWHASDRTWWRRTDTGALVRADAPVIVETVAAGAGAVTDCFECGSTLLGPLCGACNPEIARLMGEGPHYARAVDACCDMMASALAAHVTEMYPRMALAEPQMSAAIAAFVRAYGRIEIERAGRGVGLIFDADARDTIAENLRDLLRAFVRTSFPCADQSGWKSFLTSLGNCAYNTARFALDRLGKAAAESTSDTVAFALASGGRMIDGGEVVLDMVVGSSQPAADVER